LQCDQFALNSSPVPSKSKRKKKKKQTKTITKARSKNQRTKSIGYPMFSNAYQHHSTNEAVRYAYRTVAEKIGPHNRNIDAKPYFSRATVMALLDVGGLASTHSALRACALFLDYDSATEVGRSRARGSEALAVAALDALVDTRNGNRSEREILWDALCGTWSANGYKDENGELTIL
jgi:hypothetical protein